MEAAGLLVPALTPIVVDGVVATYASLKNRYFSSKNMKQIREELEKGMKTLGDKRDKYKSTKMLSNIFDPSNIYDKWDCSVSDIEEDVKTIVTKSKNPLRINHGKYSEVMKEMVNKAIKLLEEGDGFLAYPERVERIENTPNIKGIKSREEVLENIVNLLKNNNVQRIGIHGTLGIGKTTIMQNLNNHAEVAKMFDIIIWLNVSTEESDKNFSGEHLQNAIMRRLKLRIDNIATEMEVAKIISEKLEGKKYLLLLDDVKEKLDLSQVGIPAPDGKNGGKMVLTTRLPHVAVNMDVDRPVTVSSLSNDEEAMMMFQGFLPKLNPHLFPVAYLLCKDCGGHPHFIEIVAKTFELNSTKSWDDRVDSYRHWPEKDVQGIKEFYKKLQKFCYDRLEDDMKKCFLYGALYPEDRDIYIDYLLECWAAEEFLKGENSYIRGHAILDDLKNESFQQGESDEYVRMYKCFRKVALFILSENECLVKTRETLERPLDEKSWKHKKWISIIHRKLEKLPDCSYNGWFSRVWNFLANCPNCDNLSTLLLSHVSGLTTISPSFFNDKINLRVLDLSHTDIEFLPPSISRLIRLKVLNLSECEHLKKLEKLEHIESLDLRGSGIIGIPHHPENLGCLRHLRVSFAKSRNENTSQELSFNEDAISKLSSLESLVIDLNSKEQWSNKLAEKIIEEVANLENFTSLKFSFPNAVVDLIKVMPSPPTLLICVHEAYNLQNYINKSHSWRKIQDINSFQCFIGCKSSKDLQMPQLHLYNRYIKYCDGEGFNPLNLEADAFELVNYKNIKQLSEFPVTSMKEIRSFFVKSCMTIETILDTGNHVILQNLEHLYVMDVPNLVSVWKGCTGSESPSKLKTLVLSSCPRLIKIFPDHVIHQLDKIQYLEIKDCSEIQQIILEAEIDESVQVLPELKKLTLVNLPKLRSIYPNESLKWPSLEDLEMYNCPRLLKLPFNKDNTEKLKSIKAEKDWLETLQFQNEEVKDYFRKLAS